MVNNKIIKSNRMISITNKIIMLLASVLLFGCSLSAPQMVKNDSDQFSEIASSVSVESEVVENMEADVMVEGQSIVSRELKESESKKVATEEAIKNK